jgi:hypothetical protein
MKKLLMTAAALASCGFFVWTDNRQGRRFIPRLRPQRAAGSKWGPRTTKALYTRIQEAVGADRNLDEELCLNLTAYILQANGARPGTQALTTATDVEIRSVATGVAQH